MPRLHLSPNPMPKAYAAQGSGSGKRKTKNEKRPSAHDPVALLALWRRIAKAAKLTSTVLTEVEGLPILAFETQAAARGERAHYLSTGVHGDEAGSAWGLPLWAEAHIEQLKREAFLICPLLNPVGLSRNTRHDHRDLDLNRRFHLTRDPIIGPWRRWLRGRPLALGLCLHEDYDGLGTYIYELSPDKKAALAEAALTASAAAVPRDLRKSIDGHAAKHGIIRRDAAPAEVVGPEAIILQRDFGCAATLTIETPSEFALEARAQAQSLCVAAVLEHYHAHG